MLETVAKETEVKNRSKSLGLKEWVSGLDALRTQKPMSERKTKYKSWTQKELTRRSRKRKYQEKRKQKDLKRRAILRHEAIQRHTTSLPKQ